MLGGCSRVGYGGKAAGFFSICAAACNGEHGGKGTDQHGGRRYVVNVVDSDAPCSSGSVSSETLRREPRAARRRITSAVNNDRREPRRRCQSTGRAARTRLNTHALYLMGSYLYELSVQMCSPRANRRRCRRDDSQRMRGPDSPGASHSLLVAVPGSARAQASRWMCRQARD